jgi:Skp family chaperone for outer membrane proteins
MRLKFEEFRVLLFIIIAISLLVWSGHIVSVLQPKTEPSASEGARTAVYCGNLIMALGSLLLAAYALKLFSKATWPIDNEGQLNTNIEVDALKARLKIVEEQLAKSSCNVEQMTKLTELAGKLQKKTKTTKGEGTLKEETEITEPSFAFTEQLDAFFLQLNRKSAETHSESCNHNY